MKCECTLYVCNEDAIKIWYGCHCEKDHKGPHTHWGDNYHIQWVRNEHMIIHDTEPAVVTNEMREHCKKVMFTELLELESDKIGDMI